MHCIAPIVASEIYALSADRQALGGNLYLLVGVGGGALATLALLRLRDTKAAWRDEPSGAAAGGE